MVYLGFILDINGIQIGLGIIQDILKIMDMIHVSIEITYQIV